MEFSETLLSITYAEQSMRCLPKMGYRTLKIWENSAWLSWSLLSVLSVFFP